MTALRHGDGSRTWSSRFIASNNAISDRIARHWPFSTESYSETYIREVLTVARPGSRITDVGAGHRTVFADRLPAGCELIGVDLLPDDLASNAALTVRVAADVMTDGLPDQARDSDLVCSHFVVEHMPDLDTFAAEAFRVLRPGGTTAHIFAGRWSVFAVLNRLLPERLSQRILFRLRPEAVDIAGFETHYDRTSPAAARRVFEQAGFERVRVDVSWESSPYFRWFVPLFLIARITESLLRRLRLTGLASYVVLVARKPG